MKVKDLIDKLSTLNPYDYIITQVVAKNNQAWNCHLEVNDIKGCDWAQLRVSHEDLEHLNLKEEDENAT